MAHATAAPEGAGRYDNLHGDEDGHWPTAREQAEIERLADEKLKCRLYDDLVQFDDLMAGIDPVIYLPQLQRALGNLDRACKGERNALDAITTALSQIQRVVKGEAERLWLDDLKDEVTAEVLGTVEA